MANSIVSVATINLIGVISFVLSYFELITQKQSIYLTAISGAIAVLLINRGVLR